MAQGNSAQSSAAGVIALTGAGEEMMQVARRASLIVVLLLASVGTASAECAWVLWVQSTVTEGAQTSTSPWEVVQAAQSERCDRRALAVSQSGVFTVATAGSGTFLKALNDGSEFVDVATLGTAVLASFGQCRAEGAR